MRPLFAALAALASIALVAAPAGAAPCQKPRQMKLIWDGARGQGQLVYVAYGCALPATCPTKAGAAALELPVKVDVRAGGASLFAAEIRPCDGAECRSVLSGPCPGGAEAHKAAQGMVKLSFQRQGRASVMSRARGPMARPAETAGPVTVTLTDAGGYAAEATFAKCRFRARPNNATMVCR